MRNVLVFCIVFMLSFGTVFAFTRDTEIYHDKPEGYSQFVEQALKFEPRFKTMNDAYLDYDCMRYAKRNEPLLGYIGNYRRDYEDENGYGGYANVNENIAKDKAKIEKGKAVLDKIKVSGSDYWKAWRLYCIIGTLISYKDNGVDTECIYAAYTKKGQCQAYSKCYKYVCQKNGLECETVYGSGHMWNIVKINGVWYNVDCTAYSDYANMYDCNLSIFLVSDAVMKEAFEVESAPTERKEFCKKNYPCPERPKSLKLKTTKGKVTVTWKKAKNSNGTYYVAYKYKGQKYNVVKTKKLTHTIKAKSKRTVYVKVRTYDGAYTSAKKIKVK